MLIMQFFWKYIDDLMGKGLGVFVILELLFFVSASLIPLALPLAMLLSSIMTMGNLAENNELTALKSSGLSLYRIMRPLTMVVLLISIGTFYFANYIIPISNLKWRALIYDIQETKIANIVTPGQYSNEIDNYAIKVNKEENGIFKGITIHDHSSPNSIKTIRAEEGELFNSSNGSVLYLKLKYGAVIEELDVNQPIGFTSANNSYFRSQKSKFSSAVLQIKLSGFQLNRTDENLFKNAHEMLNVFQLNNALDSIKKQNTELIKNFVVSDRINSIYLTKINDSTNRQTPNLKPVSFDLKKISKENQRKIIELSLTTIDNKINTLNNQKALSDSMTTNLNSYKIEFHRKFALTFSILVLFFVGAPLGAIVKKGGFGTPVVIATLIFMIYFVLTEIGQGLVKSGAVPAYVGMWLATISLTPIALLLMRSAANDSKVFDKDAWLKLFRKKKR
jgi:lipopolysaccharide export system permease protein